LARSYQQLSQYERDIIGVLRAEGWTFKAIGEVLGRNQSMTSREYKRNQVAEAGYLPSMVHNQARERKVNSASLKSKCFGYEERIHSLLQLGWTPAQIAGELSKHKARFSVSHETVYSFIYQHRMPWAKLLPRKQNHVGLKGWGERVRREK